MSHAQNRELHRLSSNVREAFDTWKMLSGSAHRVVYSAVHRSSGVKVAIKVLRPFDHVSLCVRTLNEVKLLRHFRHPNIVSILHVEKQYDYDNFNKVYIIQELMDTDLRKAIRTLELSNDHCQYFVWQTLCALDAIHCAGVLHRDLKPSNLLINENCDLKVCDFNLARSAARVKAEQGSTREYATHLWYRAPEITQAFAQYTDAIDIWSLGCIFAEMLTGKPLFPGQDTGHQLDLIFDVLGTPAEEDTEWILSGPVRKELHRRTFKRKVPWNNVFPNASADALDLMARLLTFDPTKRINAKEALRHPYLEAYHARNSEPSGGPIPDEFFCFDEEKGALNKVQLKRLIYEEVMRQ